MNKAFDDLIYQSGLIADGCWDELGTYEQEAIERLIELIVLECVVIVGSMEEPHQDIAKLIKQHFGVEE